MAREPNGQGISGGVRLGVIGAGWFASRRHIPDAVADPRVSLAALCRRDEEARSRMAAHFNVAPEHTYANWTRMLEEVELDAVLITTPHNLHYEQVRAALERGLHVLIEKPMTLRSEEARELVTTAARRGLKLSVALNPPFWAHCHRARRSLGSEKMGPLESASMYWSGTADYLFGRGERPENMPGIVSPTMYRADPRQNGGGYFIDGGPHLVSELVWLTGLRVRRVSAIMDAVPADMRVVLSVEMENGAVATITSIGDSRYGQRRVRNIFGCANGTVHIQHIEFETSIHIMGQESQKFREADLMPVASPIVNFVDAIVNDTPLYSPGEHGAHVVEIIEAAYESATTGRTITLPDAPTAAPAAVVTVSP